MVRKGIERGLSSEIDEGVGRFFKLYADNQHRHGTPALGRRYFEALRSTFGQDCEVLTVLDPSGISGVLGSVVLLPRRGAAVLRRRRRARASLAANDFKYWELMRRACERGLRMFDYGRSKRGTGSFDFKKNWGFEATPLAYEYKLLKRAEIPQNNPANPKYRAMIALWQRLPRSVVNAIGPSIVRNLG